MTRIDRIKEHLDHLEAIGGKIRICPAIAKGSACACNGCAGSVNGTRIRQHEIDRWIKNKNQ